MPENEPREEASEAYRSIRLHVEALPEAGGLLTLPREQAHYLTRVMRLGPGARVALFNAGQGEWTARIESAGRHDCVVALERRTRAPAPPASDVWLLFAPLKRNATDLVVQKATELGAAAILPVLTRRGVAQRTNLERLQAIAVEAAEQSERLDVPRLAEPVPLADLLGDWPEGRGLYVCDETGQGLPAAPALTMAGRGPAAILCGPEGGFTPEELDLLRRFPFATHLHLGPRILRAETAALAALAVWQAVCGDWRDPPSRSGTGF